MGQLVAVTRKHDSLEKSASFNMGKGAELRVVSKRNQLIWSKDEQEETSEENIF